MLRPISDRHRAANRLGSGFDQRGGAAERGDDIMKAEANRYFTVEQLEELAVAKYIEAALTPEGFERDELLDEAKRFASRAKMKSWLMGEIGVTAPSRGLH
jgi:hypothetical protein